jgi:hypothetical protein
LNFSEYTLGPSLIIEENSSSSSSSSATVTQTAPPPLPPRQSRPPVPLPRSRAPPLSSEPSTSDATRLEKPNLRLRPVRQIKRLIASKKQKENKKVPPPPKTNNNIVVQPVYDCFVSLNNLTPPTSGTPAPVPAPRRKIDKIDKFPLLRKHLESVKNIEPEEMEQDM